MNIESLIKTIRTETPFIAMQAIHELGEMQDPQAAEVLIEVLYYGNVMTQQAAAEALATYNEDKVAEALCTALKETSPMVRLKIVKSMERLNRRDTIPSLMMALRGEEAESLQYTIIEVLGNMNAVQARDLIASYLMHPNQHVRKRAHNAFKKLSATSGDS